jgi:hypothetical protein
MSDSKKIGVTHDPWRQPEPEPEPDTSKVAEVDLSELTADLQESKYTTIDLPGYGGVTITGTDTNKVAVAQLLAFCVDNRALIDDTLVSFGVLLAELPAGAPNMTFYIQRHDGWTLGVPQAQTRDAGCLQLIQALLALKGNAKVASLLKKYRLQPYRT